MAQLREIGFCPKCNSQVEIKSGGVRPYGQPLRTRCSNCGQTVKPDRVCHILAGGK